MSLQEDRDSAEIEQGDPRPLGKQSSVSELVRNYDGSRATEEG